MTSEEQPIKQIIALAQDHWDHSGESEKVRSNFHKVLLCRTPALGAEVYASDAEEKVVCHTCKSRCCPGCGNRGTELWKREQEAMIPNIPFVGIVFTMPNLFWPVFRDHPHLENDLPSLAAAVLRQWAWNKSRVRVFGLTILHTFGGRLNYHPHVHMMVSAGGLNAAEAKWVKSLAFNWEEIMNLWRFAVTSYLLNANRCGYLRKSSLHHQFEEATLRTRKRGLERAH
jgi:hypothetical protein